MGSITQSHFGNASQLQVGAVVGNTRTSLEEQPTSTMKCLGVLVTLALLACPGRALYGAGGMLMGGYGMAGMGGMMEGHSHGHGEDSDLLLNCAATFTNDDGTINNELAVTIESVASKSHSSGTTGYIGLGYAPVYGYGYGYGYGGYGYGGLGGHGQKNKEQLKATIEIFSRNAGGKGFVVFTERANPSGGCTADNFGAVLTESMGGHTSMGGLSTGLGLYTGYGYGYPLMGSYGYGLGMGHSHGLFGGHGHDKEEGAGIAAEINIIPATLTTASVDRLEFHELADLAGRGVAVCSEVTYDWQWQPTCVEPYFSCCALKYDNAMSRLSIAP